MMQNMITGRLGSIDCGVKLSTFARWPCWMIHTSAPNDALTDSTFMAMALSGSTTDPRSKKSATIVVSMTNPIAIGVRSSRY